MSTEAAKTPEGAKKWRVPQSLLDRCVEEMEKSLDTGTLRDKQTTASIVRGMLESNLKHDEFDDKRARLDSGKPTEISDNVALGHTISDFRDRLGGILGDGAGADTRVVKVVDPSEAEVRGIEDRAEPSDADEEATRGA